MGMSICVVPKCNSCMLHCSSYWKTQVDVYRTSYLILVHALKIEQCMPKVQCIILVVNQGVVYIV